MDGGTLNPSMLMIIAVQESEHASRDVRPRPPQKSGTARGNLKIWQSWVQPCAGDTQRGHSVRVQPWAGNLHLFIRLSFFYPSMWWRAMQSCPSPLNDKLPLLNRSALIGWWFITLGGLPRSEAFDCCDNFLQIQKWRHISGEDFFFSPMLHGQTSVIMMRFWPWMKKKSYC